MGILGRRRALKPLESNTDGMRIDVAAHQHHWQIDFGDVTIGHCAQCLGTAQKPPGLVSENLIVPGAMGRADRLVRDKNLVVGAVVRIIAEQFLGACVDLLIAGTGAILAPALSFRGWDRVWAALEHQSPDQRMHGVGGPMHDHAGPETVAEHKYTFKACFGEKPDRCFDFLTGIGKYSSPVI